MSLIGGLQVHAAERDRGQIRIVYACDNGGVIACICLFGGSYLIIICGNNIAVLVGKRKCWCLCRAVIFKLRLSDGNSRIVNVINLTAKAFFVRCVGFAVCADKAVVLVIYLVRADIFIGIRAFDKVIFEGVRAALENI